MGIFSDNSEKKSEEEVNKRESVMTPAEILFFNLVCGDERLRAEIYKKFIKHHRDSPEQFATYLKLLKEKGLLIY